MTRALACLFLFCLLLTPALILADDGPAAQRPDPLEHRLREAATKEQLAKARLAAEAVNKATPNQAQYDVKHYELELGVTPATQSFSGLVTATAQVTGTAIGTFDLDLDGGMGVSAVTSGGSPATFSRAGHVLTVNLDRTYNPGEMVTVSVSYSGNPQGGSFGWSSYGGQPMVWTLSEPFGARDWWPCKDLNTDKADSMDIIVTVPSSLVVGSNGLMVSDVVTGPNRTFHWHTNYPIAPYLVSLAIHPYTIYSDSYPPLGGGDPMPVQFFVYPDHLTTVQPTYALTVPMIQVFAGGFGEYPFVDEKYGHAEFTWGGGMEHQTLTSMGGWSEDLISHELAHQWWGDMITCADFGHIWLNEGFATWSEAYWDEITYGAEAYRQTMDVGAYYGAGTVIVEDPLTQSIFDTNLSYNKGSWVVHMLRGVLGDTDFFAGLALYRADHIYGSATTEDLQAAMETVSGHDLQAFFQQWVYGEYYPVYRASWTEGAMAGQVDVTIEQVQTNTGPFTMPVELRFDTDQGIVDVTVDNSLAMEQYTLDVPGIVNSMTVDPDRWILRKVESFVTSAPLNQGILLVNGVDFATYGAEITSAYADSTFSGTHDFSFWDCFPAPAGGYPPELPAPVGHGPVPADIIGDYSTVIWVGNNYAGDLPKWQETPIHSYLQAGGNVLLMSRMSASFLEGDLATYLDVTFAETGATLGECAPVAAGLVAMPFLSTQSWNDVYLTTTGPETSLLFVDSVGFSSTRGTGAIRVPAGGGTFRPDGGRLAHIGGRPYRMDHAALRQNVDQILANSLLEPYVGPSPVEDTPRAASAGLGPNYPNPFNPQTVIPFSLPRGGEATVSVYDARGSLVRVLSSGPRTAGDHTVRWDGTDRAGKAVPSGSYFVLLRTANGESSARSIMLVR